LWAFSLDLFPSPRLCASARDAFLPVEIAENSENFGLIRVTGDSKVFIFPIKNIIFSVESLA
jgi:hypothetical protein